MKALLKSKKYFDNKTKNFVTPAPVWVDVDTTHLFNNQYNCIGVDYRVMDADILAIKDDARINKGICRYCGAIIERGHEEEHYKEQEGKGCPGCWWFRDRRTNEPQTTIKRLKNNNGETLKERTTKITYKKVCTYSESSGSRTGCALTECRAHGIKWFTPENTFFLKYPNGYQQGTKELKAITFDFVPGWERSSDCMIYPKKFGSFVLTACYSITGNFNYFEIANCREKVRFLINYTGGDNLDILLWDSFGYTSSKSFKGWHKILTCNDLLKAFFIKRLKAIQEGKR